MQWPAEAPHGSVLSAFPALSQAQPQGVSYFDFVSESLTKGLRSASPWPLPAFHCFWRFFHIHGDWARDFAVFSKMSFPFLLFIRHFGIEKGQRLLHSTVLKHSCLICFFFFSNLTINFFQLTEAFCRVMFSFRFLGSFHPFTAWWFFFSLLIVYLGTGSRRLWLWVGQLWSGRTSRAFWEHSLVTSLLEILYRSIVSSQFISLSYVVLLCAFMRLYILRIIKTSLNTSFKKNRSNFYLPAIPSRGTGFLLLPNSTSCCFLCSKDQRYRGTKSSVLCWKRR